MDRSPEDPTEVTEFMELDGSDSAWPTFAGIILGLLGIFNIVEGLLSLFNQQYKASVGFFFFSAAGWGWLHLLLGLALTGIAGALLARIDWAPAIAVGLAGAASIFQMIYINILSMWSIVNIALAVLVIYALVVKGHDVLGVAAYRVSPVAEDEEPGA